MSEDQEKAELIADIMGGLWGHHALENMDDGEDSPLKESKDEEPVRLSYGIYDRRAQSLPDVDASEIEAVEMAIEAELAIKRHKELPREASGLR